MTSEYLVRLAAAAAIGAAIGAEREYRDKAAGLRTIMLICIGSCLFTIMGQELIDPDRGDPVRIASAIVSGVGFLGAGVIFRRGKQATGITTAAAIWCSAGLGMSAGGGRFAIAFAAAAGILVVLWVLPPVERFIDARSEAKIYEMHTKLDEVTIDDLHQLFEQQGLHVINCSHGKRRDEMITHFEALGQHDAHTAMSHSLIDAPWVVELST